MAFGDSFKFTSCSLVVVSVMLVASQFHVFVVLFSGVNFFTLALAVCRNQLHNTRRGGREKKTKKKKTKQKKGEQQQKSVDSFIPCI